MKSFCTPLTHDVDELITLFANCFLSSHNTILVRGDDEPIYLPKDDNSPFHRIVFAHGFFASALHEISHWLIAGDKRRELVDFGYWYEPDGRTKEQQALFQVVEIKPQALEWILSKACMFPFRVSNDNLNGQTADTALFKQNIYNQVMMYCQNGLPERAAHLRKALCHFYGTDLSLKSEDFTLDELD